MSSRLGMSCGLRSNCGLRMGCGLRMSRRLRMSCRLRVSSRLSMSGLGLIRTGCSCLIRGCLVFIRAGCSGLVRGCFVLVRTSCGGLVLGCLVFIRAGCSGLVRGCLVLVRTSCGGLILGCLVFIRTGCSGLVRGCLVFIRTGCSCLTLFSFVLVRTSCGVLVLGCLVFIRTGCSCLILDCLVLIRTGCRGLILGCLVRRARLPGGNHSMSAKLRGLRSCSDCRPPVVHGRQECMVGAGSVHMLGLQFHWRPVLLVCRCLFCLGRAGANSTRAAVIADMVHGGVIDHGLVVNIVNVRGVHVIHRAVVAEGSVIPISAFIADTTIAEAVVDAAVEADMRAPIAFIPGVGVAAPTPIPGSPEEANFGSHDPGTRHPEVAIITIAPVAGCP